MPATSAASKRRRVSASTFGFISAPRIATGGPCRLWVDGAVGDERLVRRLPIRLERDQLAEHLVDPLDDAGPGAEVAREGLAGPDHRLGVEVGLDARATEAIDRLLGVADHEEAAFGYDDVLPSLLTSITPAGDPDGELDLDRVGVLELVEQEPLVAIVERGAGVLGPGEQVSGQARAGRGTPAARCAGVPAPRPAHDRRPSERGGAGTGRRSCRAGRRPAPGWP